ncbi:hypothetical protein NL676_002638 [Syzygium grande]|nr:hypothetical protein NL676_002638 [Syzygium grande]
MSRSATAGNRRGIRACQRGWIAIEEEEASRRRWQDQWRRNRTGGRLEAKTSEVERSGIWVDRGRRNGGRVGEGVPEVTLLERGARAVFRLPSFLAGAPMNQGRGSFFSFFFVVRQ